MKISQKLTIISCLLLVAGCAHQDRQAQYNENSPSSTYSASTPSSATSYGAANSSFGNRSSTGQGATDQTLASQVKQSINTDTTLAAIAPKIDVMAQNGTVTLTGSVPTEQDKQRIETMARNTSGVVSVNNQLQVSVQPTSERSGQSSRIYTEPNQASTIGTEPLRTDSTLESAKTDLSSTEKSSLQPTPTGQNTDSAVGASTKTPDSTSPTDVSPTSQPGSPSRIYSTTQTSTAGQAGDSLNLNVQGATDTDRTLGQTVMQELRTDASLAGQLSAIKMNIENGKITLTGTVKSENQKQSIESAVKRVTGVASVDDQLQVSAIPTSTSDTDQNK